MRTVDLSIILPVYNVAPYLRQCLDSIANQVAMPREIIAIDDGSTDESLAILSNYATNDLPMLRIVRQENSGLSAARNAGLRLTTGKWVSFIDSDDFIAPTMFRKTVEAAEQDDLDILLCNGVYHFDDGRSDIPIYPTPIETYLQSGSDWLKRRLSSRQIAHMVWLHLYKKSFLEGCRLEFVPGRVHEDVIWTNKVLLAANRVRQINDTFYFYRIRKARSGADAVRRSLEYMIPCSIDNALELADLANTIADKALSDLMRWQAFNSGNAVFHLIEKLPKHCDRLKQLDLLSERGFLRMMWNNAGSLAEKRKVARAIAKKLFRYS
ncbi:MAG: glycosyltransferase [Chitinophagia bacterium]|nr:glycosyltransferase [Chitinophagia bacterium]